MSNILITGATGNIGVDLIQYLFQLNSANNIFVAVRNIEKAKRVFSDYPKLNFVNFDFEDFQTYESALTGIDRIFLLRPPHISDIDTYFKPLISLFKDKKIREIVFLSVQGAEKSSVIPHNKIERLIRENDFDYIFLRPSYFMQNLTTTLFQDIKTKREIILPANDAKFNWIDCKNIAEITAILLGNFGKFKNQAIELTGLENENFSTVTSLINESINQKLTYRSVNPFRFYQIKKRDGMEKGMILVMFLLHFLPRFQKEPRISTFYEQLTGKKPTDLKSFIEREKNLFAS